jgi:RNA-directed DNA polymerase
MRLHESAMAFRENRSILSNAKTHANSRFFVRVDFSDFFHSIRHADLMLSLAGSEVTRELTARYTDTSEFIARICFDSNLRLPIGYISSPAISNAVMFEFDTRLENILHANVDKTGAFKITRYADDIVFSTDKKGGCNSFFELFAAFTQTWASPSLSINTEKTVFSSRTGGSAIVTGLRVCNDGHITVDRRYKDKIRLLLSLHAKQRLQQEELPMLRGHLNYIRHVAPAFYSSLCSKYSTIISEFI